VADAIAQGAQGFVGKEKPIGSIVEALERAFRGHLPVDSYMLQEILRPHDAEDRRNVGRPDRRNVGRPDRCQPSRYWDEQPGSVSKVNN
jgi:DNA-binding NarL/FixJ family response regulator